MSNLFANLPVETKDEVFTELLSRLGARIEPELFRTANLPQSIHPSIRTIDEWVLLLRGSASLWVDGDGEHDLHPGDWHILIPARRTHRVTRTAKDEPTVWLAVHFC